MRRALVLLLLAGCAKEEARPAPPPVVAVRFESDPPGADIAIDGQPTGRKTPADIELRRMTAANVTFTLKGFEPWTGPFVAAVHGATVRGRLERRVPLLVESEPPGATVRLDGGVVLAATPGRIDAPAGPIALRFEKAGFVPLEQTHVVSESARTVRVKLLPAAYVEVTSTPSGAALFVDGAPTGLSTPARVSVQAGAAHELSAHLGVLSDSATVRPMKPGKSARLQLELRDRAEEERAATRKKLLARIRSLEHEKKNVELRARRLELVDALRFTEAKRRAEALDTQIGELMQQLAELEP